MLATISIPDCPAIPEGFNQVEYSVVNPVRKASNRHFSDMASAVDYYLDHGRRNTLVVTATRWITDEDCESLESQFNSDSQSWTDWSPMQ